MSRCWLAIKTALALKGFQAQAAAERVDKKYDFGISWGGSGFMKILETIGRVANTEASILILGESGTGKELIAEAVQSE
ncbi:sigma 54-interacting transcriptional regulator [Okeania hirsuta]|uniref:sigma 54-interacting transcriptional regulator n=1 Tax=Okeania hirsuta TaxID=1458930 RepID=UPI0019607A55|nr:sigma 54-interacting transcriptional regulator [Okeania hirsuta]